MKCCVSVYQVAGIKGMLIANKRQDNQVRTYITYNKGRDWRLLQAPAADLDGNDIHCILVKYCAGAAVYTDVTLIQQVETCQA